MTVELDRPAAEIQRLERCINDLVGLLGLSATWVGRDPSHIARTLLDALEGMLALDLVFLRLIHPSTGAPIVMARGTPGRQLPARADALAEMLDQWLDRDPRQWPPVLRKRFGERELSLIPLQVGLQSDLGVLIAGSERADFPSETERMLLTVAKNQAVIALQEARLLGEQKLLAEARETAILNSALDCIITIDHQGRITEFNPAAERTFGYRREDVLGAVLGDLIVPPALRERHRQGMARYLATGHGTVIGRRVETTALRADGTEFPVELAITRIPGDEPPSFTGYLRDITERKRAEDALAAGERDLKLIIDTIPALAWSARPDGSAEFFNQHYLDFVGLSAEQARDWGWTRAVHPEDLSGLAADWQRIMRAGKPGESEARLRRHDGEYRWFLFRTNPLRNENGSIVRWYGVNTDIEGRKRAEVELRRAYDSFADAQRLSKTGSFITDLVGDDHNWSEETYRIFEFEPGTKVTVERIRDIVHPDDLPSFDAVIARGMSGGDVNFSFRIVTARGTVKHVRGVAHVIERIENRPMFVGALQDVTETMFAEEALNRARSELTRVARVTSLGTLAASIAHEVNQPLSGIVTNASTCLRMLAGDPPNLAGARETARRTIRDGHRASEVINRLRGLFTRKTTVAESVDLNAATREVITLTASELRRGGVVVREELTEDLPAVTGDRIQLQQVILNLLLNATDAMSGVNNRPRELVVRTGLHEGGVCVSVQDSGVGFAPEDCERLFEAFYTTKAQGMGIGLSVSRSVIERHSGRIWASPNEGPGATFSFSVPADANTKV